MTQRIDTFAEYQTAALRTALGEKGDLETEAGKTALVWNALGVAGEAGEVADLIKKGVFHGHGIERDKLVKELGDVLWYLAVLAHHAGSDLAEVAAANVAKLLARYPNGWDPARSQNRAADDAVAAPTTPAPVGRVSVWGYAETETSEDWMGNHSSRQAAIDEWRCYFAGEEAFWVRRGERPNPDEYFDVTCLIEVAEEQCVEDLGIDDGSNALSITTVDARELQRIVDDWARRRVTVRGWMSVDDPERIEMKPKESAA